MANRGPWVTASDLADYAYCPRAQWYRAHPPAEGSTRESQDRAAAGSRYHRRVLGAERRRAEHGNVYWVALAVGATLVIGGAAWILHP